VENGGHLEKGNSTGKTRCLKGKDKEVKDQMPRKKLP